MSDLCTLCDIDPVYEAGICKDCYEMHFNTIYDLETIGHKIMIKKIRHLVDKSSEEREIDYIKVPVLPNTKKGDRARLFGYDIIFDNKPLHLFYKDQTVWRTV